MILIRPWTFSHFRKYDLFHIWYFIEGIVTWFFIFPSIGYVGMCARCYPDGTWTNTISEKIIAFLHPLYVRARSRTTWCVSTLQGAPKGMSQILLGTWNRDWLHCVVTILFAWTSQTALTALQMALLTTHTLHGLRTPQTLQRSGKNFQKQFATSDGCKHIDCTWSFTAVRWRLCRKRVGLAWCPRSTGSYPIYSTYIGSNYI